MSTYAGFRLRLSAFLWDYLVIFGYILLVTLVIWWLALRMLAELANRVFSNPYWFDAFAFLVLVLPVILYFSVTEASRWQASLGKRKLGLQVDSLDGQRISWIRSFVRSGLKFLPWQIAHTCIFHIPGWPAHVQNIPPGVEFGLVIVWLLVSASVIFLAFDPSHRTLYDRIAGTVVKRKT